MTGSSSNAGAPHSLEAAAAPVLSVVTCMYNEEQTARELVQRVLEACRPLGEPFEFLVVNDGSRDGTLATLIELSARHPELRVIDLYRNFGHMAALSAGLDCARGQAVVLLDGDLQDPPELIPDLYRQWRAGADVVYGLRTHRREGLLRRGATAAFYWLLEKTSDTPIPRQVGTFSLLDRRVVDALRSLPERQRFVAGLRAWVGGRQVAVPYERQARRAGTSRVGALGLFRLARSSLLAFSKAPLRWASLLSLTCGLVLFAVGITAIAIRLFDALRGTRLAIPGWATYTTLIGMMGFVQSLALTMLAEYVAIIFDEIKQRPLYLIREEYVGGRPRGGAAPQRPTADAPRAATG